MFIHVYKDSLVANRKKKTASFLKKNVSMKIQSGIHISYMIYIYILYIFSYLYYYKYTFPLEVGSISPASRTSTTPLACIPCMAPGEFFCNAKGPNTVPVLPS